MKVIKINKYLTFVRHWLIWRVIFTDDIQITSYPLGKATNVKEKINADQQ